MLYVNTFVTQRYRVACMYPILEHVQCIYLGHTIDVQSSYVQPVNVNAKI